MIELQGAPAVGRALAGEADRGVDRDPIELGVCINVSLQSGQCLPDLGQGFPDTNLPRRTDSMNKRGRPLRILFRFSFTSSRNLCSSAGVEFNLGPYLISRCGRENYYLQRKLFLTVFLGKSSGGMKADYVAAPLRTRPGQKITPYSDWAAPISSGCRRGGAGSIEINDSGAGRSGEPLTARPIMNLMW